MAVSIVGFCLPFCQPRVKHTFCLVCADMYMCITGFVSALHTARPRAPRVARQLGGSVSSPRTVIASAQKTCFTLSGHCQQRSSSVPLLRFATRRLLVPQLALLRSSPVQIIAPPCAMLPAPKGFQNPGRLPRK